MSDSIKLVDICSPKQWKTIGTSELSATGYPVYGANGIIGYHSSYNHENETVLITCRGATCGEIHICQPKSYVNGNAMCLDNLSSEINIRFLFYYLKWYDFRNVISGSAQPQITIIGLNKVSLPVYSLEQQKQIAATLDKATHLIDLCNAILEKLDLFVKARFVEMFGENTNKIQLGEISTVTGGITKNSKRNSMQLKLPYLRVANVYYAHIDVSEIMEIGLTEEEMNKTLLQNEDILFVEGNGSPDQIGRVAIWHNEIAPCVHQNHLIRVRLNKRIVLPTYCMFYFMSQDGRAQIKKKAVSTSGLYTLSVSKISDLLIPLPPLELQEQFAAFVAQTDKTKAAVQQVLAKAETLKKALMQEYFG